MTRIGNVFVVADEVESTATMRVTRSASGTCVSEQRHVVTDNSATYASDTVVAEDTTAALTSRSGASAT